MEALTAGITGLLTLAGVWLGTVLDRRNKHKVWLLEKRAEAFTVFLTRMEACLMNLSNISENMNGSYAIHLTENYLPVSYQEKVVRLYISSANRNEFSSLTKDIWGRYSSLTSLSESRGEIYRNIETIQQLFEIDIEQPKLLTTFSKKLNIKLS